MADSLETERRTWIEIKMDRIISVSTAAFDGYDLSVAIDEISRLGVDHVEMAFIQGYTDPFGEEVFQP